MRSIFQSLSHLGEESARFDQPGLICVLCLFIFLCAFMSGICLLLYFRNHNCFKELQNRLDAVEKKLLSQEYLLKSTDNHFKDQLDKDEFKSRFQTITANQSEVPEKY